MKLSAGVGSKKFWLLFSVVTISKNSKGVIFKIVTISTNSKGLLFEIATISKNSKGVLFKIVTYSNYLQIVTNKVDILTILSYVISFSVQKADNYILEYSTTLFPIYSDKLIIVQNHKH